MGDAFTRLADAVEAGNRHGLNRTMAEIGQPSDAWPWDWMSRMDAAFNGSLDAAKALHEAVLTGWIAKPQIGGAGAGVTVWHCTIEDWDSGQEISADNMPDPARAWLLAIIRALAHVQK